MSKDKCPECHGTGWYRGKQKYRAVNCSECNGKGVLGWEAIIQDAIKAGLRSNPQYEPVPYANRQGIKKIKWID